MSPERDKKHEKYHAINFMFVCDNWKPSERINVL